MALLAFERDLKVTHEDFPDPVGPMMALIPCLKTALWGEIQQDIECSDKLSMNSNTLLRGLPLQNIIFRAVRKDLKKNSLYE